MPMFAERGRRVRLGSALASALLLASIVWGAGPASAVEPAPPPTYDGLMAFPAIQDASYAEEYSWTVTLGHEQTLVQVDERHAEVRWGDSTVAFTIEAESAHDAVGANVPTSLEVSGVDVITLTVHHRAGNPAAGGTSFVYPVTAGPGWEGGSQPPTVISSPQPSGPASEAPATENPQLRMRLPSAARIRALVKRRERARSVGCRRLGGGTATSHWRCAVRRGRSRGVLQVRAHLNPASTLLTIRAHGHGLRAFVVRWRPPASAS